MAISRELAGQKWVLLTTAQTPTNIAVIKYWGKRDEDLILPVNDSISVTLDPSHLCTITTVAVSPNFEKDRMWLNRKVRFLRVSLSLAHLVKLHMILVGFGFEIWCVLYCWIFSQRWFVSSGIHLILTVGNGFGEIDVGVCSVFDICGNAVEILE